MTETVGEQPKAGVYQSRAMPEAGLRSVPFSKAVTKPAQLQKEKGGCAERRS